MRLSPTTPIPGHRTDGRGGAADAAPVLALAGGGGDEFGDLFGLFAAEDPGRHPSGRGRAVDAVFDRVEDAFLDLLDRGLVFGRSGGREQLVEVGREVAVGSRRVERVAVAAVGLEEGLA